jgi:flotillin
LKHQHVTFCFTGEAEAKKDSTIAEALAEEQRMQAKLVNDTEIARAKRDYELKKAGYDTEVSSQGADPPPP